MRARLLVTLAALLLVGLRGVSAQDDTVLAGIEDLEFVEWVTGPESPNQTDVRYDIDGTDLGSMFVQGDTLYIAFGDTFGCCRPSGGGAGGANWRNNALAYSSDRDPEDGITIDGMITEPDGTARAVLHRMRDDVTVIPTYGIAIGERLYLHYMAVREWGPPGRWTLNRSGWAYSDNGGRTWTQPRDAIWEGDTNFGQAALVEHEGMVYVFGIHGGRFGGVALARVPGDSLLDMSAYRYWDGEGWSEDINDAVEIVPPPVGELSVAWNEYLGRWIMTYLHELRAEIVIREAPELTGPWSDLTTLVRGVDYPSLYGAYLHPWASDGQVIYFNMSQWGPYNVRLMRARLVKGGE
ncbi:MAG: DUF4185 domain-containing protein [Chloroflexota bacterium]|nr:MAG: hypothetical protein DIU68_02205 [Chloroflexota bacterium]